MKKAVRIADWLSGPLFEVECYFFGKPPLTAVIQKGRVRYDILLIRTTILTISILGVTIAAVIGPSSAVV